MTLTLLTGGARSGKSSMAVRRAAATSAPVVFVATAEPRDEEMAARIRRHRAERPDSWRTVEEARELARVVAEQPAGATVVVDCLAVWVSNLMERGDGEPEIVAHAARLAEACGRRGDATTVVVTNEVGHGLVPMHPVGRAFRDLLGRVNVTVAEGADLVQLVVAGRVLTLERDDAAPPDATETETEEPDTDE